MASLRKDDVRENTCVVCFKEVEMYSIGQCDHPVCFECSTRMRVLCRQNECPICRQDMPMVIFTPTVKLFENIKNGKFVLDNKYKISFFSNAEKAAYDDLLAHVCPECRKVSPNFGNLREHVRRVHQLNYCDLCVDNLMILTRERRCYNRQELATHRRLGDPDDRSHRGHPLCEFCDKRYMDNDELYRHLRRDHLFCHFCDADGLHYYYKTYESLREHYRTDHYLCEEGDCYMEKFTSVFRTDIDLKAHKASQHGKGLGKAGLKQARTLDIEFTLAPRPRPQRNNRYHNQGPSGSNAREDEPDGAIGGVAEEPPPQSRAPPKEPPKPASSQLNTNCKEEFPSLGGSAPLPALAAAAASGSRKTASASLRPRSHFSMEDFPALGPEVPQGRANPPQTRPNPPQSRQNPPSGVTTSVTMRVNTERPSASSPQPPQTNLSIQVSSPRFTTTVTSQKTTYSMNFPALDGGGAPPVVSSSASLQWTTKKKQTKDSQTQSQPSTAASQLNKPKPVPKMDDFPALEPKSNKPLFPTGPPKISTATNTVKTVRTEEPFAQTKTKKKKGKKVGSTTLNNNINNNNNVVAVSSSVKKKPAETGGGEPAATSFRSAAQEKRALLYDGMVETESSVVRQAGPNMKLVTAEEVMMMRGNAGGKENKKESANKPVNMDESAFPALGFGPPPGFEAKWEAKKTTKTKSGPPPGLDKPKAAEGRPRAPPGLENPLPMGLEPPNPPPGFSSTDGSFPPLAVECAYAMPPHFERRNTTLVDKISKSVGTATLNDFKQISGAFRGSLLSGEDYYNYCKEAMGGDGFVSIFPELLALLPEIGKQQELWPHYKAEKDRFEASTTKANRLEACATCGQVVRSGDLRDHLTRHTLDNHFPVLDQKAAAKNAWSK